MVIASMWDPPDVAALVTCDPRMSAMWLTVDENKNNQNGSCSPTETHVFQTIHRSQRFSKKLKRRLTIRTIAEAKALKKQSKEAIHVLFYAAEMVSSLVTSIII